MDTTIAKIAGMLGQSHPWLATIAGFNPATSNADWEAVYTAAPNQKVRNILMANKPQERITAEAAAEEKRLARANGLGKGYYAYESSLVKAGVILGRDGQYRLSSPVSVSYHVGGSGKQFTKIPAGSLVNVRWYADMAGKYGHGENRQRRAEVDVV